MFENYFVTCNVAVALKKIGFDEPCMAWFEYYEIDGKTTQAFHIAYSNAPTNPGMYNDMIKEILESRSIDISPARMNSRLQPWQYAAPLYQQVFEWLETKGLYLHPYRVPRLRELPEWYGVNIFNEKGKQVWPIVPLNKDYHENATMYYFPDKKSAYWHSILAAIEILKEHAT